MCTRLRGETTSHELGLLILLDWWLSLSGLNPVALLLLTLSAPKGLPDSQDVCEVVFLPRALVEFSPCVTAECAPLLLSIATKLEMIYAIATRRVAAMLAFAPTGHPHAADLASHFVAFLYA